MGLEKIGINFARSIVNYAKTCGKTYILETKPIINRANAENLGYICSKGTINFNSVDSALVYAKNKCVKALRSEIPYEHSVSIKGSRIVHESSTRSSQNCALPGQLAADISCHGHPDTYAKHCTTAPSMGDFEGLSQNPYQKKEIVFNSAGEYYILEKLPEFIRDKNLIMGNNAKIDLKFWRHFFELLPQNAQKELEIAIKNKDLNLFNNLLNKYVSNRPEDITKEVVEKTHTFWTKYAKDFGVKIETNFFNFKNLA
jgi:hypothetical protein